MIISFSAANFLSFSTEETLNLVASRRLGQKHVDHEIEIPGSEEKVLRVAVIYGANGAGKSNLFRALSYVEQMVLHSRQKGTGTGRKAFRLGSCDQEPSSFDLRFIADDTVFRFGFKADDHQIREEWLAQVDGSKETILYQRITNEAGEVKVETPGLKRAGKLKALAEVGGPPNQTFLATVHVTLQPEDLDGALRKALEWFEQALQMVAPDSSTGPVRTLIAEEQDFKEFASEFLKSASTGVDHLEAVRNEITEEDLKVLFPKHVVSNVLKAVAESPQGKAILETPDSELLIERAETNRFYRVTAQSMHRRPQGQDVAFNLGEESDGTQRLLSLIPALYHQKKHRDTRIFFVDEIDRSMHPKLVYEFLKFFVESSEGTRRQLIVTTHESNLLDLDLLRRDEIWFAEKDADSATHLYSLSDFKVRNDLEIRKHYLQGRFGAIPFLGNLERLLGDEVCAE